METNRVSSGISYLDSEIKGGFPKGSVIAYLGKPGIGKTTAGLKFIEKGIQNNEQTLIITTNSTVPQVKMLGFEVGIDLNNSTFIDAAIWRIRRINPKIENSSPFEVSNLTDLNALLALIIQVCKELGNVKRVLFDTPSSLLLYSTPGTEQVFKFFELLTAFTRYNGITLIFTLEVGVHQPLIVSTLLFLSDGSINYRFSTTNQITRQLKISFLWLTNIIPKWIEM